MKAYFIGHDNQIDEFKNHHGNALEIITSNQFDHAELTQINICDIFIHAYADDLTDLSWLAQIKVSVLLNAVKKKLKDLMSSIQLNSNAAGINYLPTFIKRNVLELSFYGEVNPGVELFASTVNCKILKVDDKPGMVTPAIICMLINESSFLLEDQTASIVDIDHAMKLGTAYPFGPLEWADKIGISNVVDVLNSMKNSDQTKRYEISGLLTEMSKTQKLFYKP